MRDEILHGRTYKLTPSNCEYSVYITINNDTEGRPYEMFINCKNSEIHQWCIALALSVSTVFRSNADIPEFVKNLCGVVSNAGYHKKGHGYMHSLVADIGYVIESHLG